MASKYDDLSATAELEQTLSADLAAALAPRGAEVVHNGTATMSAPGGRADIEVRDVANRRLLLVEVTRRVGSAADGEFIAIADHLDRAIADGGYESYGCLFVSPATSARMSSNLLERNRQRKHDGRPGRFVAVDFTGLDLLQQKYRESDPHMYPMSRFGPLLDRWADAADDARARRLLAETLFEEDAALHQDLSDEMRRIDAEREQRLKRDVELLENKLRDRGITGNAANSALIYLTFLRLYEEKRHREGRSPNHFTRPGFDAWAEAQSPSTRTRHPGRLVVALLGDLAEDPDLKAAGLLWDGEVKQTLPNGVDDLMVRDLVLPVFDQYNFYAPSVDVLGVVFETLARRGEKDTRVGQFFTPQSVVDFAADLIQLQPGDVVLDPAVGTARFLIAAMRRELAKIDASGKPPDEAERDIKAKQLLGSDIDPWVSTIAKMNMYIHGDGKSSMIQGNGLALADRGAFASYPHGIAGKIDIVLTNPPLGNTSYRVAMEHWRGLASIPVADSEAMDFYRGLGVVPMRDAPLTADQRQRSILSERARRLTTELAEFTGSDAQRQLIADRLNGVVDRLGASPAPSPVTTQVVTGERMKGGALFLGAIAQYLKSERLTTGEPIESRGGRAIVVVDEAILNTPEYKEVRDFIRRKFYVKAVVSLGRAAFQYLAHTDAKTSILYLVRKPNDDLTQREPIFFGHAEAVGYSRTGRWIGSDLPRVFGDYAAVRDAISVAYSGPRFQSDAFERAVAAITGYGSMWHVQMPDTDQKARLDFFNARYRDIVSRLIRSGVDLVPLAELIEPRSGPHPEASRTGTYEFASVDRITGQVRRKGPQAVAYGPAALWIVESGDIVVSGIDAVHGAIALATPEVAGTVMSKEMFAYRVKAGANVNPGYIVEMLRAPVARDLLFGLVTGTSNRNRLTDPSELLSLPVPRPPARVDQDAVAEERLKSHRLRAAATEASHRAAEVATGYWSVELNAVTDEAERVEALTSAAVAEGTGSI